MVNNIKEVLLVDPDTEVTSILGAFFENSNKIRFSIAHDAQQAIHESDKISPDCIILELKIAENNGMAFMHEFRSHGDWLNVPVILHTMIPKSEIGVAELILEGMGVAAYLYKPSTSLKKLNATVHEVLDI